MTRNCLSVLLLLLFSEAVLAGEGWQFRLSPYMWLAGLKGDVGTIPPLPAVPVDISASDALKDFEGGGMVLFDARRGRHGVLIDLLYTDVRSDIALVPPPIDLSMRSISKTTIATLGYEYAVYSQDQLVLELFAGIRYWETDTRLEFGGGAGVLAGRNISHTESWVDPAIGIKGRAPFGRSRFYFEGGAGIGGFSVGSKFAYALNANVGYQWSRSIGTALGYRLFDVDYEHNGYVYDVRQQGWQLGLTWAF